MKTRLLFVPLLLALVASLAACGGSSNVPANAVALVNGTPIPASQFRGFLAQAVAIAVSQGQKPTPGTPAYTTLRDQVVAYLVQYAEVKQQASKEGVSVSKGDVTAFLTNLAKTQFKGSMAKLAATLKKQGLDMTTARQEVYLNLLGQKLKTKVTATAKVTTAQEQDYYNTNKAQYSVPAATTRNIAHILVKTKAEALTLEKKLQAGANFADLAKKYSTDTGSAPNGGKLCMAKSGQSGSCTQMVPPFAKAGFALKTGQISAPVHSQFGWHIIKALGPITNVKAHTTPFSQAQPTIQSTLLQAAQEKLWQQWLTDLTNQYKGKVSYQGGYAPATTTALPTTT
ncbi:MAG TPA: peptidylprolyl isomerase [Gaiellaceae bacterium]|nr:peptidylprolyl isomerase [Gaiellaceae bacterium]